MSFTPTDIELFQGGYAEFDYYVTDLNGDPVNLALYTIKSQVRTQPGALGELLLTFDVVDIGLSAGYFRLFASASACAALPDPLNVPARKYYNAAWDVFVAPTGAASATRDSQYAAGVAYIYPRTTQR